MKKLLSLVLALAMVLALAACGEKPVTTTAAPSTPAATTPAKTDPAPAGTTEAAAVDWPATMQRFSCGTGGTTGAFYIIGAGICNVVTTNAKNIEISAEVTGATLDNIAMCAAGDCEFGISNADFAMYAYEGIENYDKPQDILAIASLYPTTCHIVASKSSGITSLEDMKGKRISVGPFGSGNRMGSQRLLEMVGLSFDDITEMDLTNAEAIDSLKDGTIDAFILYSGAPLSSIIDLTTTTDVTWISLSDEFIAKFVEKYPYYMGLTLAKDVYNTAEEVNCIGVNNIMIVNKDVPEDIVYLVTKTMYENAEEIWKVHTEAKKITLDTATNVPIPLHPGAEKYFKEVGVLK